jgi:hypothetical protein
MKYSSFRSVQRAGRWIAWVAAAGFAPSLSAESSRCYCFFITRLSLSSLTSCLFVLHLSADFLV